MRQSIYSKYSQDNNEKENEKNFYIKMMSYNILAD